MQLKSQYEFLFVGRDEGSFLENYAYNVSEGERGSAQVFVCLEIQNNPAEAEMIGETVFEAFKKSFFAQKDEKDAYVRFENSLKEINKVIDGFREGKTTGHIGRLHMVAAAISGDNIYLSQTGDAEAYLIRKKFVTPISEGLFDPKSKEAFTSIANGNLEPGDFILFASTRLLRYVSKTNLARTVSADPVRTLSELRDAVSGEILGKIGFIGISFTSIEESSPKHEFSYGEVKKENKSSFVSGLFALKDKMKSFSFADFSDAKLPSWVPKLSKTGTVGRLMSRARERFSGGGFTKDKVLAALIGVILVLSLGIWFVKNQSAHSAEVLALDTKLNQAREKVNEAEAKGTYDKEAAAVLLKQAEDDAREISNSGSHRAKASEVLALISKTRDLLDNIKRVSDPRVLADLSTKDSKVNALGFVSMNNRFFVYDPSRVFEVIIDKIQDPFIIDENDPVISATGFDERESVLLYTKSGKVFELKDGIVRPMATLDGAFRKGVAIEDWGNRLYILDAVGDQIWRYPYVKSKDVFGTAEGYKVDGSVKEAVDIGIDGSVYVLNNKQGDVVRFYGGSRQTFNIQNPPFTPATNAARFYTDGDISFAFVLDSVESKVYVYAKDKTTNNYAYRYQVLFDTLKDLRDVYFDQGTNQLYVMDGKKIYEATL